MKASIVSKTQTLKVISDPAQVSAALDGNLTIRGKTVLAVKGGDTSNSVGIIYRKFANSRDGDGKPFVFSRKLGGLCHTNPLWKNRKRITGPEFEAYLRQWFSFVQQVADTGGQPALVLTDELPAFFVALISQGRYVAAHAELFQFAD